MENLVGNEALTMGTILVGWLAILIVRGAKWGIVTSVVFGAIVTFSVVTGIYASPDADFTRLPVVISVILPLSILVFLVPFGVCALLRLLLRTLTGTSAPA